MSASLQHDWILSQVQDYDAEDAENDNLGYSDDPFAGARGMVNGFLASLIFWAIAIYLVMR